MVFFWHQKPFKKISTPESRLGRNLNAMTVSCYRLYLGKITVKILYADSV